MRTAVETGRYSLAMELEQVRFLEASLPEEIYDRVVHSDIAREYDRTLRTTGCSVSEYDTAERQYRTLLTSILTDSRLMSQFIN